MPTRKKGPARNATVEHVNTKTSRHPRRSTSSAVPDKKVNDLITSSSKKQKPAENLQKKNEILSGGRTLTSLSDCTDTENEVANVPSSSMLDHKQSNENDEELSIFSQPFHHHNEDDGDGLGKVPMQSTCGNRKLENNEFSELGSLSPEVSAIYLAMQHSKLECIDEQSQDSISTDGCPEPDETEELDEFDPYTFIKDLPELSMVVPKFRPVLLPKQTRSCPRTTLVLDLDETLVHSTLEPCEDSDFTFPVHFNLREHTIYVRCRPYLKEFLERVASMFEIIIFTASQSIYAEQLLNVLDPKRRLFRHRVYRDSCVYVEGNYLKDLTVLGRDLSRVVIVDNSPQAFGFQLDNGVPIESWFDDPNDKELLALLPFLESLVGVEDVRPFIATKFNLRQKVASATSLAMHFFPNA
ncbi:CTD small phosphatase-like protein 2 isoform X1 [Lolium rigidum]|uniref:CTD small phosphatase-like protein 2 isoform X1 n=1 Tax=Lolium rigidum TaxID=89674 RepID=UPI001F5D8785|nr:CTD small phosphatase-like protein 2 isoform X1 [Lolium rigidum]XP_047087910.1 CTD small phosphatase-like protein 2 isoform X1 [Lolium rigidum]